MKAFARMSLVGSGLGLMVLAAAPSFATVQPVLNVGSDGSITVTPTSITFNQDDTNVPGSSAEVATGDDTELFGWSPYAWPTHQHQRWGAD